MILNFFCFDPDTKLSTTKHFALNTETKRYTTANWTRFELVGFIPISFSHMVEIENRCIRDNYIRTTDKAEFFGTTEKYEGGY